MRYLATYILLKLSGKVNPTADEVANALDATGIEVDRERLNMLMASVQGKDLKKLIAEGSSMFVSVGGGGASVSAPAAAATSAPTASGATKESKEPAKKEEESAEDIGGVTDMFGKNEDY